MLPHRSPSASGHILQGVFLEGVVLITLKCASDRLLNVCVCPSLRSVLKRCPMLKLRCPRGLKENDFLDLLRSTFPQLSGENSFDILTPNERRRLQLVNIKTVDIRGNISCRGWTKSTLYIRPRVCHIFLAASLEDMTCLSSETSQMESKLLVFPDTEGT